MGGESPSGGGGSSGPVGVTFETRFLHKPEKTNREEAAEVDALAQPMAGSKSTDLFSVGPRTSYKSTESESE